LQEIRPKITTTTEVNETSAKCVGTSEPATLRILLVDDHAVIRRALQGLLAGIPGYEVCGEGVDGIDAVRQAVRLRPDIVVMDLSMPRLDGIECARRIRKHLSNVAIIFLTMHESEEVLLNILRAGALGYVLKSDAAEDFVTALDCVRYGQPFLTSRMMHLVNTTFSERNRGDHCPLTPREREMAQLFAEGKSAKEVASVFGTSPRTVETQRAGFMRKLRIDSTAALVRYAIREGIVAP
jgi:DNA-binding NarL/FixJ family response regulator